LSGLDVTGIAINGYVLTASVNANVQQRFEILDVLIVNPEQCFQPTRW
jgi:hypothetical protein